MSCSAWPWYICKVYSRNGDCIRKTMLGWQCKPQWGGGSFNGEGGGMQLFNTVVLKLYCLTGYWCKRFYRIPIFPIFLLFYLFCIYWDWQGQKCKLKCPKVYEINSELYCNCNFCLYSFLRYKHLALPTTSQEYICCSLKSIISEWSFFEIKKFSI